MVTFWKVAKNLPNPETTVWSYVFKIGFMVLIFLTFSIVFTVSFCLGRFSSLLNVIT